jgi:hypothetical protein
MGEASRAKSQISVRIDPADLRELEAIGAAMKPVALNRNVMIGLAVREYVAAVREPGLSEERLIETISRAMTAETVKKMPDEMLVKRVKQLAQVFKAIKEQGGALRAEITRRRQAETPKGKK